MAEHGDSRRSSAVAQGRQVGLAAPRRQTSTRVGCFDADHFGSQTIYRVDVAATGPGSPVPPGIPDLPGPGQFYASPALARLLR